MTAEPIFVNCCHCRDCQKFSGSAFAINATIESSAVELLQGEETLSEERGETCCGKCGVRLWATLEQFGNDIRFLAVGTLDEGERITPDAHFFIRSKHPWVVLPEGVPAFETLPGEGDPPLMSAESRARLDSART